MYTLTYSAASAGQSLTISFTQTSGGGSLVDLLAATLQTSNTPSACSLTPIDASASTAAAPVSCSMSIAATLNSGGLTLANDSAATVTGSPPVLGGAPIIVPFSFTTIVRDHRGSTNGWLLEASSAGITNNTTTYPLTFTSAGSGSSCMNGTCSPTTFTAIDPLTTTPQIFEQVGSTNHTTVIEGDYTLVTNGNCTFPADAPVGTYTGVITISLLNSF